MVLNTDLDAAGSIIAHALEVRELPYGVHKVRGDDRERIGVIPDESGEAEESRRG